MKRKSFVDYFLTEDVLKRNKINDEYSTVHSTVQNYNAYSSSSSEQDWSYQNLHRPSEDLIHSYSSHHNYIDNSSSSYSNSISMSNKTSNYNSNYSVSRNDSHLKYRPTARTMTYNNNNNDSYSRSANNNTTGPYIDDSRSTNNNNNNHNNKIYGQNNNTGYQYNKNNNNILNEQKYNSTGNEYNIFKHKRAPYQSGKNLNYDPNRDDYNSHYINQIELSSPASNKNLESYLNDSISISMSSDMFFPKFNVLFEGYNKYIILLLLLFVYKYATK